MLKIILALLLGYAAYAYYEDPQDNFIVNTIDSVVEVFDSFFGNIQGQTDKANQRNQEYVDRLDSIEEN